MSARAHLVVLSCALALAPSVASAGDVIVVPPLIAKGTDAKSVANVTALISSEVGFSSRVENTVEPDAAPSSSCMTSTSCLKTLTSSNEGTQAVVGTLAAGSGTYVIEALLYDLASNTIVRKNTWTVASDSSAMADAITPLVQELLNGTSQQAAAAAAPSAATFEDDEEFEFAAPVPVPVPTGPSPAELAKQQAAAAAAAAQAKAAAEAERKRLEAEAVAAAAAAAAAEEFDPSAISFGSAATQMTAESISFAPATAQPAAPAPKPVTRPVVVEEEDLDEAMVDLDEGADDLRASKTTEKAPKSSSGSATIEKGGGGGEAGAFGLAFRGGYSKYFSFGFITFGGEAAIPAGPVHLVAGIEVYAVNRQVPEDLWAEVGKISEWNTIFPVNFGVVYKIGDGMAQPYVGADVIAVNYFESSFAAGARARGGLDIMVTPQFGLNLNLAVGMWSGSRWGEVQEGIGNSGVLPQVSLGTVIAF